MSNDKRKSTLDALNAYSSRHAKQSLPKKSRKNAKPEKLVEQDCLFWMRQMSWDVQIYESKATYDPRAGCWRNQSMKKGNPDCMGIIPSTGTMVCVEFKAKGKLSTFNQTRNHAQKDFIINKIYQNAFACVVDSSQLLSDIYIGWKNSQDKINYLLSRLP